MPNQVPRASGVKTKGGNILAGEIVRVEHDQNRKFLTITNDGTENLKVYIGHKEENIPEQDSLGNYMLLKGVSAGSVPGESIWAPPVIPVDVIYLLPETPSADFKASVITDSDLVLKAYTP